METSPNPLPMREAGPYSRHVAALDGLRGMAVLGVMASHLFAGGGSGLVVAAAHSIFTFGATGVDLFFVLSGFLITGILFDSLSDTRFFRKFYARRALRIFPLYYGVLLVLFALTPVLGLVWHKMNWVLLLYLQNTNIAGPFYQFNPSANINLDHFWSLAVEEQFYLVWPLVVYLVRDRKRLLWVCAVVSCGSLALRFVLTFHDAIYHTVNRNTLCRADSLLLGAALSLILRGRYHDAVLSWSRRILVAVVLVVAGLNWLRLLLVKEGLPLFAFDASYLALRYSLMALGSGALIAWCLRPHSLPKQIFEGKILRFFGKYSYGLYVLHLIALPVLIREIRLGVGHFTPNKGVQVVIAGLVSFGLSVGAAYLSYQYYEKPFLKLKRFFDYKAVSAEGTAGKPDLAAG